MEKQVFKTSVAKIWTTDDGISIQEFFENVDVNLSDLKEIVKIANKHFNKENLILVDISKGQSISYEAREFLKSEEASMNVKAVAYKTNSKTNRIIGNFLTYVNKPDYPTKLFTNEEKAIKWLLKHKTENISE